MMNPNLFLPSVRAFSLIVMSTIAAGYIVARGQEVHPKDAQDSINKDAADKNPQGKVTIANPYQVKVHLIVIQVVVRDSSGRAVGTLHQEDFDVFDNRKQEKITDFSVQKSQPPGTPASASNPANAAKFVRPDRFTALFFDDLHSTFANLPQTQAASLKLISSSLARNERLGIFSASGKLSIDFTDDRAKLQDAVKRLTPSPMPGSQPSSCPTLTHSQANEIVNRHSTAERNNAEAEVMGQCGVKDPRMAHDMVISTAEEVLRAGDAQTAVLMKSLHPTRPPGISSWTTSHPFGFTKLPGERHPAHRISAGRSRHSCAHHHQHSGYAWRLRR